MKNARYLIWLQLTVGVGKAIKPIIDYFDSAENLYNSNYLQRKVCPNVTDKMLDAMETYSIRWIDTYAKSQGYGPDFYRYDAEIKANNVKDGKYVSELKPGDVITKKDGSKWDVVFIRHTPFGIQVRMNSETSPVKTEEITYRPTDMLVYDSIKDADEYMIEGNIVDKDDPTMTYQAYQNIARKYHLTIKNYTGDMLDLYGSKNDLQRYERDMHMSYSSIEKVHDSVNDSIGSDIVSEVKRAYPGVGVSQVAKNRLANNGKNYRSTELTFDFNKISDKFESADRMFSYIQTKHPDEVQTFKKSNKTYVVTIFENLKKDSLQKDSLTVRDVIQSLVTEETSAISSYNVALETLKDHIPDEAYKAIKAIRDDEQRHVENLYAVLNGNVTPKNLEN